MASVMGLNALTLNASNRKKAPLLPGKWGRAE